MTLEYGGGRLLNPLFVLILCGCTQQHPMAPTNEARGLPPEPPPPPTLPSEAELREAALALGAGDCSDLKRIKHLVPKAAQLGHDVYYDRIYMHPVEYRACLIDSISDETPIPPVHSGPGLRITNLGDMAYHMLGDMQAVPPNDCVPDEVNKNMETHGAFAFHQWRRDPATRLQWAKCIQRHFAEEG